MCFCWTPSKFLHWNSLSRQSVIRGFCVHCILYEALVSILFIIIIVIIIVSFFFLILYIEKVRRENHIKCFQLETRNIFSSISLSAKVCIFPFSIALGKYQHWILLKFLPAHSERAFFFYWITAISNITLHMQMLKWKFNLSICKHSINFRVARNAWKKCLIKF